jgi:aldose 1-epimerase
MTVNAPSGQQYALEAGPVRAVAVEVGGGLRTLEVDGRPLLDGYRESEMASGAQGQPLLPWPNRLPGGRWSWEGQDLVLPVDEPGTGCAIHGLTRWSGWTRHELGPGRLALGHVLVPRPGWPFRLTLRMGYALTSGGVEVSVAARNDGPQAAPFGAGMHPYLTVDTPLIDAAVLTVPASARVVMGADHLPSGVADVAGDTDFRTSRALAATRLDDCFTRLDRDADGRARVRLSGGGRAVELWVDGSWPYLMVFTGDTLEPDRRRRALAVEPMTCPPGALATGQDLVRLEPGQEWEGRFGIEAVAP